MLKMSCLANAAIIFLLCLGIVGCASTQTEEEQEIPEAEGAEGYSESADHPENTPYDSDDAQVTVILPEDITLDKLKDEVEAMRSAALAEGLDKTMPDEWQAAEEAYNRGMEAFAEAEQGFTDAAGQYLSMGIESDLAYLADADAEIAEGTELDAEAGAEIAAETKLDADADALPAFYRVGDWNITGDCFWNISEKPIIYGDPIKWHFLYEANKDGIPDPNNPDLILPDTILVIPSIDGEYREGTYDSLTDTIELGDVGALNLNYFNIASASISRYVNVAYVSVNR